ncbi:hypothetical protein ACFXDO_33490 [Streptomyces nigra]|uniref:hypothetical protein n=1 Tax=Streptomyces nigra TaxID=1827580 RepID=UPI0036C28D15
MSIRFVTAPAAVTKYVAVCSLLAAAAAALGFLLGNTGSPATAASDTTATARVTPVSHEIEWP